MASRRVSAHKRKMSPETPEPARLRELDEQTPSHSVKRALTAADDAGSRHSLPSSKPASEGARTQERAAALRNTRLFNAPLRSHPPAEASSPVDECGGALDAGPDSDDESRAIAEAEAAAASAFAASAAASSPEAALNPPEAATAARGKNRDGEVAFFLASEARNALARAAKMSRLFRLPAVESGVVADPVVLEEDLVFSWAHAGHAYSAALAVQKIFSGKQLGATEVQALKWKLNNLLRLSEPDIERKHSRSPAFIAPTLGRAVLTCDVIWMYRALFPDSISRQLYDKLVNGIASEYRPTSSMAHRFPTLSSVGLLVLLMHYYKQGMRPNAVLVVEAKKMIMNKTYGKGFNFAKYRAFLTTDDCTLLEQMGYFI